MLMNTSTTGESSNRSGYFYGQTAEGIHLLVPTLSRWASVSRASIVWHNFQQGDKTVAPWKTCVFK